MRPFRVEAPEGVLVPWNSTNGLAIFCGLEVDDERQALIEGFEQAAVDYLDGYSGRLGRCILRQKWALPLTDAAQVVQLPFPDCRDFQIEDRSIEGEWSVVEGTVLDCLTLGGIPDQVVLTDLPDDHSGLFLTCIAGWETVAEVPDNLKQAVKFLVAHWFEHRSAVSTTGSVSQVPLAFNAMISPLVNVFA